MTVLFSRVIQSHVSIFYQGVPTRDPDWGGFYFEGGYAYNLGIGLTSNPPNYGRGWFPCFDNFVERSTYQYGVLSSNGRKAYCVGTFISEENMGGDSLLRTYRMDQQIPTYLSNVAISNYAPINYIHTGMNGDIPVQLLARPQDTTAMKNSFANLPDAIDALEYWYGPYPWERVGYVLTTVGAMEHPTNVAYPDGVANGDPESNNRLITHELGHHWWGNLTTLRQPHDMWIKEGPAEYSAHLMRERTFGKEDFHRTVMNNLEFVLSQAHINDDGYMALSPMPFENTYGTHTYQKGALVIHNLRGYLGDDMFRAGMRSILNTFPYNSIDAYIFRDHISNTTGFDLTDFFNDWVFAPGYNTFYIADQATTQNGNIWQVDLQLKQKLHRAPHFHANVPLEVSCYNSNWERFTSNITADGSESTATIDCPFEPVMVALNETNKINQARLHGNLIAKETGFTSVPFADFLVNPTVISDSALVRVEHHLAGPDPVIDHPYIDKISSTHFWTVDGIWPDGFEAEGRVQYSGGGALELDHELTGMTEDSIILAFRENASTEWYEYPFYTKFVLSQNDGRGFIRIDQLIKGHYAFANGFSDPTSVNKVAFDDPQFKVSPNPSDGQIKFELAMERNEPMHIRIMDMNGKELYSKAVASADRSIEMDLSVLASGLYLGVLTTKRGNVVAGRKIQLTR